MAPSSSAIGVHPLSRLSSGPAAESPIGLGLVEISALNFYLRNGWRAGHTVVLNIMGVDFEETFMSKRLNRRNAARESP